MEEIETKIASVKIKRTKDALFERAEQIEVGYKESLAAFEEFVSLRKVIYVPKDDSKRNLTKVSIH